MSNVKSIAFQRGMSMLAASGAVYAVYNNHTLHCSSSVSFAMETEDGLVGTLEVVPKKKKARRAERVNWGYTGYAEGLTALAIGGVWDYQAKDKAEAQGLQRAATGKAGQLWGPGNFISSVDHTYKLEILRVV